MNKRVESSPNASSLLFIELNECNPDFLLLSAKIMGLTHVLKILSCPHALTTTQEQAEGQGLDPWAQWVSIHCGKPMTAHGIQRPGATQEQTLPQLWHAVANHGYSWGAWGVMNAPMGNPQGCCFFMPDPWSFDEIAYPGYFNDLLALPRYVSRNYFDMDYTKVFAACVRLMRFFAPAKHWKILSHLLAQTLKARKANRLDVHTFTTLLDYVSVLLFVRLRQEKKPDLSIIFLNHIAHLQHHFWVTGEKLHPQMELGLRLCDAMLGLLLADRRDNEALVVMNGFRQENVAHQGFYVYRQRNPHTALQSLGIAGGQVEQNMTHDANVIFPTREEADNAFEVLGRYRLGDNRTLFFVERKSKTRLFFQLAFNDYLVPPDAVISDGAGHSVPFHAVFQLIGERTGAHVPQGDIFYDGIALPHQLRNHEIFDYITGYFRQPHYALSPLPEKLAG